MYRLVLLNPEKHNPRSDEDHPVTPQAKLQPSVPALCRLMSDRQWLAGETGLRSQAINPNLGTKQITSTRQRHPFLGSLAPSSLRDMLPLRIRLSMRWYSASVTDFESTANRQVREGK
ncbi:hypothetical protein CcaCcLH18_06448 [Colletotrichum camelliae]|nr:hypothetical protein CcaCcLH18_06448 [Colletotrichum camelliae]